MSPVAILRPYSLSFDVPSASSSSHDRPAVRSHYRPHSTLFVQEEQPARAVSHRHSLLLKIRRQSVLHRSVSLTDAMGIGKKKETAKLPTVQIRKLSDISASTVTNATSTKTILTLPNTSAGVAERKGGLHRVKAQRSIGSLFAAAAEVPPHSSRSKPAPLNPPPAAFRPRKMDVVPQKRPSNPRANRQSNVDFDDDFNIKKLDTFLESDVWFTRSRTKVHPYIKEVPYMQAYDIPCLDNDRYSELLLDRLNPGSPSFHDFGKKPPLSALDLGCGQGHWVLYAASVWKNSRITGFDLMDVTLPAFQTTDNVSFIRGNFLLKLPFPAKSFDYIRMANLSLCIPYDNWLPLLTEVRRVLENGGRLELIDDQIVFPYGEEPQIKNAVATEDNPSIRDTASIKVDSPAKASSLDFSDDSDFQEGDDDTLEDETSTSTTSTLVSDSEGLSDKLPSSKRSSSQSNASTSVGSEPRRSERTQPLTISVTNTVPLEPTISPSPTVTQANFSMRDPDNSTTSQSPTITGRKHYRKNISGSSTKSNSEALATWKSKKLAATEMEVIFEHVLVHTYGIHPRPSEFIVDTMQNIFGKGNAGKTKSFHIKLAPFDSPIGPGGALALAAKAEDATKVDKSDKRLWATIDDKKEKKRERKKLEKPDSPRPSLEEFAPVPTPQPAVVAAKAANRLGLVSTVPGIPRRISSEKSTGSESSTSSAIPRPNCSNVSGSSSHLPDVSAKAAGRLGIPIPTPYPTSAVASNGKKSDLHCPAAEIPTASGCTPKASNRRGRDSDREGSGSNSSDSEQSTSSSELSSNDVAKQFPAVSAKAAGRLGISYSVLASASAANSRSSGVMIPVQSPGLLVWPSTYIPMMPTELEMHSCKHVQTLLGCRHALREFITSDFDGRKLVDDADFEEAIWDYECFRRSRFLWPNDNPDLFEGNGFPESPAATTPGLSQGPSRPTRIKPSQSGRDSFESFNGQYYRDDLTHIRTIRVFEAVKVAGEKSLVSMLFPNHSLTDKMFSR